MTISYLYTTDVTLDQIHSYLKSDEGMADVIRILPQRQYPKWVAYSFQLFALIGVIAVLYAISTFIA